MSTSERQRKPLGDFTATSNKLSRGRFTYQLDIAYGSYIYCRCRHRRSTKCRASLFYFPETKEYSFRNSFHQCVKPPQDDLSQQEVEEKRQIESNYLVESVLLKQPFATKTDNKTLCQHKQNKNGASAAQQLFRVTKASKSTRKRRSHTKVDIKERNEDQIYKFAAEFNLEETKAVGGEVFYKTPPKQKHSCWISVFGNQQSTALETLKLNSFLSFEQKLIIQSVFEGNNVVVDAVAGSGKTTTILELAKVCKEVKILLLTYNTRLKNECRGKVGDAGLNNVEVHSYHSLCLKYYTDSCRSDSDIQKAITDRMPRKAEATHQLIFVDETQDMNSFHFSLLKKFISDQDLSTQYGVFGDSCQSIFQFNGADPRYMQFADRIFNCARPWVKLNLSISYRVTNQVAQFVNTHLVGYNRIKAVKEGRVVRYVVADMYQAPFKEICHYIQLGYKPDDIFILAPSIQQSSTKRNTPIEALEKKLLQQGWFVYASNNEHERVTQDLISGKIVITTFHQVKGLERKVVLVLGFDASYFMFGREKESQEQCPPSMYVALTRAVQELTVFHNKNKDYFPFVKQHQLNEDYVDLVQDNTIIKVQDVQLAVKEQIQLKQHKSQNAPDFLKFVSSSTLENSMQYINIESQSLPQKPLQLQQVIMHGSIQEDVSILYNLAVQCAVEISLTNKCSLMELLQEKGDNKTKEQLEPLKAQLANSQSLSHKSLLFLSNLYNSFYQNYTYKLSQVGDYDWCDERTFDQCMGYLKQFVKCGSQFQKSYEKQFQNTQFYCIADIVQDDELWLIKTNGNISQIDIVQLAISGWIVGTQFKSLNILDLLINQRVTIQNSEKFEELVQYLLEQKSFCHQKLTDDQFFLQARICKHCYQHFPFPNTEQKITEHIISCSQDTQTAQENFHKEQKTVCSKVSLAQFYQVLQLEPASLQILPKNLVTYFESNSIQKIFYYEQHTAQGNIYLSFGHDLKRKQFVLQSLLSSQNLKFEEVQQFLDDLLLKLKSLSFNVQTSSVDQSIDLAREQHLLLEAIDFHNFQIEQSHQNADLPLEHTIDNELVSQKSCGQDSLVGTQKEIADLKNEIGELKRQSDAKDVEYQELKQYKEQAEKIIEQLAGLHKNQLVLVDAVQEPRAPPVGFAGCLSEAQLVDVPLVLCQFQSSSGENAVKQTHTKKRTTKIAEKQAAEVAKAGKRANRDDEIEAFAKYYKENLKGAMFSQVKKTENNPSWITDILTDSSKAKKARQFVEGQRKQSEKK